MDAIAGFKSHYEAAGLYGVLAISSCRLLGRPRHISVKLPGTNISLFVRLRTTDLGHFRQILACGEYDFNLPFVPKTILDGGANIGLTSIFLANKFPAAQIIAVEPEESNYAALLKNVKQFRNIHPIRAALWKHDGEISITGAVQDGFPPGFGKAWFVTREGPGKKVRATTIQTLMDMMRWSSIDLVKLDIEGAEREIFEGNCDWVRGVRGLMIELHDRFRPGCAAAVNRVMTDFESQIKGETSLYLRKC